MGTASPSTRIGYGDPEPKEDAESLLEHMHANSGTSILGPYYSMGANGGSAYGTAIGYGSE